MKQILLIFTLVLSQSAFSVEFKIFTNEGYVGFEVEDHWPVMGMQTKLPVAVAAFQIPNEADIGTPHSTNLSVSLYDLKSEKGKKSAEKIGKSYTMVPPATSTYKKWKLFTQSATQESAEYTIIDATTEVADVVVSVRIAWPNLPKNPSSYSSTMKQKLESILTSIKGHIGKYTPNENEVIRRPTT